MERKPLKQNPQYATNALLISLLIHAYSSVQQEEKPPVQCNHFSWLKPIKVILSVCWCTRFYLYVRCCGSEVPGDTSGSPRVRQRAVCVCVCSVFSTVSPLGRSLTKVPSLPVEAWDPGASVHVCNYCTLTGHTVILFHIILVLLGLKKTEKAAFSFILSRFCSDVHKLTLQMKGHVQ